ncbi:hypothetical protein J2Z69_000246 [Paenibacillus shirakamiensis]|uniref:Uncharacterized protein n=1 Tax=Paenibacillus shirakamiensis TaxID=1265935 RepID=A0ABS4JBX6_9BACL|nr:hypothetical protein [Paenibacillus shirakamiensis]
MIKNDKIHFMDYLTISLFFLNIFANVFPVVIRFKVLIHMGLSKSWQLKNL